MLEKFWGSRPKKSQSPWEADVSDSCYNKVSNIECGGVGGASERLQYFVLLVSIAYTKSINGDHESDEKGGHEGFPHEEGHEEDTQEDGHEAETRQGFSPLKERGCY